MGDGISIQHVRPDQWVHQQPYPAGPARQGLRPPHPPGRSHLGRREAYQRWRREKKHGEEAPFVDAAGLHDLNVRFDDLTETVKALLVAYASVAETAARGMLIEEWDEGRVQTHLRFRQKVIGRMLELDSKVEAPYYGPGVEASPTAHLWRLAEAAVYATLHEVWQLWGDSPNHPRWKKRK